MKQIFKKNVSQIEPHDNETQQVYQRAYETKTILFKII